QYDSTINRWHTCPNSGRINASNPCSEYMFVDNSACNLASVNLTKFADEKQGFDTKKFQHAVRLFIVAQDILVDNASYPTREITQNSHLFRPLGLGYANLGALLMSLGKPYDSDEGRAFAGAITALLTAYAYQTSAEIASGCGTFDRYAENNEPMANVIRMHRAAVNRINGDLCPAGLVKEAERAWDAALDGGRRFGFRNAQVTVLAPTGTIGFMMDCDTTGVEPDIALVKYKQMADGGMFKIVNQTLRPALQRLGYSADQIEAILKYVNERDMIEEAPGLNPEHFPIFDCAFKPKNGSRFIHHQAHLKMMAAVQPFLTGAISKTINMPADATADDVLEVFMEGWRLGLKAVAIYRDGSKGIQPVSTGKDDDAAGVDAPHKPFRRRMPTTRHSVTHKFEVAGHQGYLTVGLYEDGSPGEMFIIMAKEGSTVGGIMDAFGTAISLCLQYGVPVSDLIEKFTHSRFEPSGFTKNPDIPYAKSLVDYIFRWMQLTFPNGQKKLVKTGEATPSAQRAAPAPAAAVQPAGDAKDGRNEQHKGFQADAPVCDQCGSITVRSGSCYRCYNCGSSMGCS
ncbi:MAG: vitamin B12-dependent ribonucleotide reductase, partial [Lentisphaerae bacterium]|nr:vitamin B12-dependent ribonucleotide reductase [Lentisphaerota bacterium]